jgi:serine/threonine protein kinase
VDIRETLRVRCDSVGLDSSGIGTLDTIRVAQHDDARASPRTLPSERDDDASVRELPRISVELRGTLGDRRDRDAPASSKRERDLEVVRTLGEGGMGRVFLARQHSLDREVAIKTVRDSASEQERAALLVEGAVVGHLEHPGVVPVHALGVDADGRPVLVMKRVEGAPWSDLLADPEHPTWAGVGGDPRDRLDANLAILGQVCSAVEFAHSRGIVHRDVKPQNILIGRYGEVVLADWGLALRLEAGEAPQPLCGTPAYMAPEMVTGGVIDARTDVYLLGATLHQILTGSSRHAGQNLHQALLAAAESAPFEYGKRVPEALGNLANRATAQEPGRRPASAAAFKEALTDYLRHRASIALADSAAERLARLRALLADVESLASAAWQREVDVVGAEVAFAVDEALRGWSENPVAKQAGAELEVLLGSRRSRAAQLERLAHELDPGVSSRQRAGALLGLAAIGVTLSLSGVLADGRAVTTRDLAFQSLGPLGAVTVFAVLLRRHLLRTLLNRRILAGLLVATSVISVNRALGMLAGVSAPQVLVFDCLALAALSTIAAFVFFRWVGWFAALLLAAAITAAVAPERALAAFSLGTGSALLLGVVFAWRMARD